MLTILEYITFIQLHFPNNSKEKSATIKDIYRDANLYKNVIDLRKLEKKKESVIKTVENHNILYEKIKGIVLESSQKR
jgi:hypothetical protein